MDAGVALPATDSATPTPPSWLRGAVRGVLEASPGYHALPSDERRALAQAMVKVSALAADLIDQEQQAERQIRDQHTRTPPLARAQAAQPAFGESASRIAGTTREILNAVSFPRFVTDLINGVFRAMLDSSTQQMQQYVQLLNMVSASSEGFARAQFGLLQVRQWLADQFPAAIEYPLPASSDDPDAEALADIELQLRDGASMPDEEEIRAVLGIAPDESVSAGSPERLVPLARRHLARQRQQMLATMVMMGMHRIVIDSGRINAAMRFHIDTRSAASEDRGSEFSLHNRIRAGAKASVGVWGASAEVENTIGYVSTQRNQNTEEMNIDLDLNSSVELNFRSDYLPLNRMASQGQAARIRRTSLNPATETALATDRNNRRQAQRQAEQERRSALDEAIRAAGEHEFSDEPLDVPEPGDNRSGQDAGEAADAAQPASQDGATADARQADAAAESSTSASP